MFAVEDGRRNVVLLCAFLHFLSFSQRGGRNSVISIDKWLNAHSERDSGHQAKLTSAPGVSVWGGRVLGGWGGNHSHGSWRLVTVSPVSWVIVRTRLQSGQQDGSLWNPRAAEGLRQTPTARREPSLENVQQCSGLLGATSPSAPGPRSQGHVWIPVCDQKKTNWHCKTAFPSKRVQWFFFPSKISKTPLEVVSLNLILSLS